MKKAIAIIAILVLCSFVLAQQEQKGIHEPGTGIEDPEMKEAGMGTGQGPEGVAEPVLISAGPQDMEQERLQEMEQAREQNRTGPVMMQDGEMIQAGLNNALQNVKNENARAAIQRNMERFLERYQERLQKMEDVNVDVDEETNETVIKAKEPVKFLGFIKGKAAKTYKVDKNGNIKEKAPWYRFLYTETKTE